VSDRVATLEPTPLPTPPALGDDLAAEGAVLVIEPPRGWQSVGLADLWRYRELLWLLTVRDVTVRYKQTLLGPVWVLVQPLLTTGIFAAVFAVFMRGEAPSVPGVPYPVSTFCGMAAWLLFANALSRSSASLINGQHLMTKVYFPRLILPLAAVLSGLVDFVVTLGVLAVMMACYGVAPGWPALALPLFVLWAVVASLAVGLWLAALSAVYRDFAQVEGVLIRIGMYLTPVAYTTASIAHVLPGWARTLYELNPMAQVVEGFRWSLFREAEPPGAMLGLSLVLTAALFFIGVHVFRRMEGIVVDVV
jgi:lipopolysaccharide transport system permease protein